MDIKVGKRYRTKDGSTTVITNNYWEGVYSTDNAINYNSDGLAYIVYFRNRVRVPDSDLIEELT